MSERLARWVRGLGPGVGVFRTCINFWLFSFFINWLILLFYMKKAEFLQVTQKKMEEGDDENV